jgi:hypothetical protein
MNTACIHNNISKEIHALEMIIEWRIPHLDQTFPTEGFAPFEIS